jgi:large-conductance mechanosensitive channel
LRACGRTARPPVEASRDAEGVPRVHPARQPRGPRRTINGSEFRYGEFINALVAFLIVAAVLFFFVIKPVNTLL